MPSKTPELFVWDTCCLLGLFNNEQDKVAGLRYEIAECESGRAQIGIPTAVMGEVVRLNDDQPADKVLEAFLENRFVQPLNTTPEIGVLTSKLGFRFDLRGQPELMQRATESGCPPDQRRLKAKDAEILATAIFYKAVRLTTYDPLLRFIGSEFVNAEYGIVVGPPDSSFLPFES